MKSYFKITVLLVLIFTVGTFYGQPPPPDGGGGSGTVTDVVPIHMLSYPFLLLGAYIGYKFIKRSL